MENTETTNGEHTKFKGFADPAYRRQRFSEAADHRAVELGYAVDGATYLRVIGWCDESWSDQADRRAVELGYHNLPHRVRTLNDATTEEDASDELAQAEEDWNG